jgi:hypothetical protein
MSKMNDAAAPPHARVPLWTGRPTLDNPGPATSGAFRRFLAALGGALRRGILGKADRNYTKQFTGSDGYWDRVIAAQRGWPREMND